MTKPRLSLLAGVLLMPAAAYALDLGPYFSLTGFAKWEETRGTNRCSGINGCQLYPNEDKQRYWADTLVPGTVYTRRTLDTTLFEPWLAGKVDVGHGFRLSALYSQRWRDGHEDIPGYRYERNAAISHEEYGSLRLGDMTTRGWSVADYPFGTNINAADAWSSSGAGYGIVRNAARYTSRILDVADGDLVLEATYSRGDPGFIVHKPGFFEVWAQYHLGDLAVDAILQSARNGNPQAWGHGPFWAPTNNPNDDPKIGDSGQGMVMVMARYLATSKFEFSAGARRNHWSGAYALVTDPGPPALWNNMFNVAWNTTQNGVPNPGYPASSWDEVLGARYLMGKWIPSASLVHLGVAETTNPTDRGQHNSATIATIGLWNDFGHGLQFYAYAGGVHYGRLGLSPMSMPSNSAFTFVDSRVARSGVWLGIGSVFVF
jgi:hypothetical protein